MMEISALTRSVTKTNHAVICPDGYVNSIIPGWVNCTVNVIISEAMGANFCQTIVTIDNEGKLTGTTKVSQIFVYILKGNCRVTVNGEVKILRQGQFVYIPVEKEYSFENSEPGTEMLTFHKEYEHIEGHRVPDVLFGDSNELTKARYLDDPSLYLRTLLPDTHSFDMAVNIFTFNPGGHLPFVETHIMEHGIMFLQGQGLYLIGQEWYPVKKRDALWIAPYCQQWFTAIGQETAAYIYYKNVNRFPIKV
jgi:(S)-ureidoglycine aminohydrolase